MTRLGGSSTVPTVDGYIASPTPIEGYLRELFPKLDARTIFDIGSCEGEDAIRYSNLFPLATVYAFEPVPDNVRLLHGNIERWAKSNIKVREVALSDQPGSAVLHVSSGRPPGAPISDWDYGNKSSSLLPPDKHLDVHPWVSFEQTINVHTDTIARILETEGLDRIDFVHLDVQGAELKVLAGAGPFLKRIGAVWMEVEAIPLYAGQPLRGEVERFMATHGFTQMVSTVGSVSGDQLYVNPCLFALRQPPLTAPRRARMRQVAKARLRRLPGARRIARAVRRLSVRRLAWSAFEGAAGRRRFQSFFRALHRLAIAGLNMGASADLPSSSGELTVINGLPPAPIVFDVGANVGDYASLVLAARPDARIWCFEPSAVAFERLSASLGERVVALQIGLSDTTGDAELFAPVTGSPMSSLYQRSHPSIEFKPSGRVNLRTLDEVCRDLSIEKIDLLKLDVEGNELAVLTGAEGMLRSGAIDAIQFEFGGSNIDSRTFLRDFFTLLEPSFRIHRIVRNGVVAVQYDELWEVFTTTNFLAIRVGRAGPP